MTNLDTEICRRFKEARKAKGLSQSSLAVEVGCKQSTISAFENGDATKLSDVTVKKISEVLGVSLEVPKKEEREPQPAAVPGMMVRGYCPDPNCPSNIPYVVGDRLLFKTLREKASPNGGGRCACCGEVLETRCGACGAPLNDGACCGVCGEPYVSITLPSGMNASSWSAARRSELLQLMSFTPSATSN